MDTPNKADTCATCGFALDAADDGDERTPCPQCGSTARSYSISCTGQLHIRGGHALKLFRQGKRPWVLHEKSEPAFQRSHNANAQREMVVDRENDRYRETVTLDETGEVVHHCEEPLSKHRGHGNKNNKP